MELYAIVLRVAVAYVFLLTLVRLSGKRTIYQGTAMDFVVALIIGDMMDDLFWAEVPASQFIVGTGVLFVAHVMTNMGVAGNRTFARLVEGQPVPVVQSGNLQPSGMRRERMNQAEVMSELRAQEIADLREVKSAQLEVNGQVSSLEEEWARPAQKADVERVKKRARGQS